MLFLNKPASGITPEKEVPESAMSRFLLYQEESVLTRKFSFKAANSRCHPNSLQRTVTVQIPLLFKPRF